MLIMYVAIVSQNEWQLALNLNQNEERERKECKMIIKQIQNAFKTQILSHILKQKTMTFILIIDIWLYLQDN